MVPVLQGEGCGVVVVAALPGRFRVLRQRTQAAANPTQAASLLLPAFSYALVTSRSALVRFCSVLVHFCPRLAIPLVPVCPVSACGVEGEVVRAPRIILSEE